MTDFDVKDYGPTLAAILNTDRCRPLSTGTPQPGLSERLQELSVEELFAPAKIADQEMAELCLAGCWLLADELDASHVISQKHESPAGSYWHGIMHRREGDFSNTKYWFRRVGQHPVFVPLYEEAQNLVKASPDCKAKEKLAAMEAWDPDAFVDLVEELLQSKSPDLTTEAGIFLCQQVAQAEWELLFADCYDQAVGI